MCYRSFIFFRCDLTTDFKNVWSRRAKLILMFALLGAALATPLEAEENSLSANDLTKMEDDDSELELQQYEAELIQRMR